MKIENWCVVSNGTPYMPPEQVMHSVKGSVYGHPHFADGETVRTSPIVDVDNREVTTASGSVYTLGNINPDYLSWCEKTEGVRVPCEGDWIRVHK